MKGTNEYIIEIKEPFNETFKTKGGIELYANKDFSAERLANRIGIVKATPLLFEGVLEVGYDVLIDPTILYEQIFRDVKQESIHLLDREKMLFKISPNLIVLYRENAQEEWKGFLDNCLVAPIEKKQEIFSSIIIIEAPKKEYEKGKAIVKYGNTALTDGAINANDTVVIDKTGGITFWLEGEEYWWLRTHEIYAKYG